MWFYDLTKGMGGHFECPLKLLNMGLWTVKGWAKPLKNTPLLKPSHSNNSMTNSNMTVLEHVNLVKSRLPGKQNPKKIANLETKWNLPLPHFDNDTFFGFQSSCYTVYTN